MNQMAGSRLTERQKKDLVACFRAGETTTSLASLYRCSPNTVIRHVKSLLPAEEYKSLKAARSRGQLVNALRGSSDSILVGSDIASGVNSIDIENQEIDNNQFLRSSAKEDDLDLSNALKSGPLDLDDAEDFGVNTGEVTTSDDELENYSQDKQSFEALPELIPLVDGIDFDDHPKALCEPLSPGLLPESVYMLVDKTVELFVKPLKELPELGYLSEDDQDLKAILLYANPRSAKRQCGRSQRVIKVPDSSVFGLSTPYLLSKGITRLVLDGSIISLDE
ncbi:helix-turn-helix domain-containing protein [Prochlorococcus sp. MIT 1300]|uniref:helix-turn-helix transcriptional regulator n=1 Tax=Prochlorococcus sp. MIT 1300 TaxID=3096218 RepID=UPI002A74FD20|nr:helix-turn-helix domain-containing protein [Prochlorococcus sp. MIT 1300]